MRDLEARLERLIRLAAPDKIALQLEDGEVVELIMEDIWDAFVEILYALKYDRDHNETKALVAIENAVPGQHPMIDLTQALIVNFRMCQQKQTEGEYLEA